MQSPKIEPHKITTPIQLLAVWFVGLIALVGAFITGSATVQTPVWLQAMFGITAVCIVPVFLTLVFLLQTRFRVQVLDDQYYSAWRERVDKTFTHFEAENVGKPPVKTQVLLSGEITPAGSLVATKIPATDGGDAREDLEAKRQRRYVANHGLFLVHSWRPSLTPGQKADITISLAQHRRGPLTEGRVESVEYNLGRHFFGSTVIKSNVEDNFRLDISAYGPVLCNARVNFTDDTPALDLERYINF